MADFVEKKIIKINATLREVISGIIFYDTWWLRFLYKIRGILAFILRLKHENAKELLMSPDKISFKTGESVSFFIVTRAKEDYYWVATAPDDRHLKVFFAIKYKFPSENIKVFQILTTVKYLHWTGPLYFNIIKPFHHLIINMMIRNLKKNYSFRNRG